MNAIEQTAMRQIGICTTAIRVLMMLGLQKEYSAQLDFTLDNLRSAALIALVETRKELLAAKRQQKLRRQNGGQSVCKTCRQ